jgi:hypothetical protein
MRNRPITSNSNSLTQPRSKSIVLTAIESSTSALQTPYAMFPTLPHLRPTDSLAQAANSSLPHLPPPRSSPPPHLFSEATNPFSELSDAPTGLLDDIPACFADLFPSIEEDNIPEDDEDEWEDEVTPATSFSTSFSESLPSSTIKLKLGRIFQALRAERWSIRDLLIHCVRETDSAGKEIILDIRGHRTAKARRRWVAQALNSPSLQGLLRDSAIAAIPGFCQELKALRAVQEPYFRTFEHTDDEKLQELDFSKAFELIKQRAPRWYNAMATLLSHERHEHASFVKPRDLKKSQEKIDRQIFMITSMICSAQAKTRSNFFASIIDIYLMGSGVKRRVIETLSGLGICHSYSKANKVLHTVSNTARVRFRSLCCTSSLPAIS